jgi:hypothetical protein
MLYGAGPTAEIKEGYQVYTDDEVFLGTVQEVNKDRFRVSGNIGSYWLVDACAGTVANNTVTLAVPESLLDDYKVQGADSLT